MLDNIIIHIERLVGPGTGVAPMRSILQEVCHRLDNYESNADKSNHKSSISDNEPNISKILMFGCRKKTRDYLFGAEWEDLQSQSQKYNVLVDTAFSQDQKNKQVY